MASILDTLSTTSYSVLQACWSPRWLVLSFAIAFSLVLRDFESTTRGVKAPIVGQWRLEPYFMTGLRFKQWSMAHLTEGYNKFKDQMFKVVRFDGIVLIIPAKFMEELRSIPESRLSPRHLQVYNLYGKSTTTDILLKSDLQARMLRNRLTPNLSRFAPNTLEEIDYTIKQEFALVGDQWTSLRINNNLLYVVAGITTQALSGNSLCRNRKWLSTCIHYTENIFLTVLVLRLFPRVVHSWISSLLPSSWATHFYLRRAKKMLIPIIEERQKALISEEEKSERPLDLLQFMVEAADGDDHDPERLAHLDLMVNLAGIHTSSMAITHAIHDLCEHPEYFNILREEIEGVLRVDGGWEKDTHLKLPKIDSFLKESQRFAPPTLYPRLTLTVSFNRIALDSLTLSSGVVIPAGTHLSVASRNILFDPEVTPNPETFDGLRYYNLRSDRTDTHRHQFASIDSNNMNFGAGRYACPRRFLASMVLKLLRAKLILEFDFRFPTGIKRPSLLVIDEFVAPVPWAKVMVKRRS